MAAGKQRITLDLDPPVQRRLQAVAALQGHSTHRYCLAAIGRALTSDETNGVRGQRSDHVDIEGLIALRQEIFGDTVLPGSAVDLMRDARDIRAAQLKDLL